MFSSKVMLASRDLSFESFDEAKKVKEKLKRAETFEPTLNFNTSKLDKQTKELVENYGNAKLVKGCKGAGDPSES